jgi:hypothetical protein
MFIARESTDQRLNVWPPLANNITDSLPMPEAVEVPYVMIPSGGLEIASDLGVGFHWSM